MGYHMKIPKNISLIPINNFVIASWGDGPSQTVEKFVKKNRQMQSILFLQVLLKSS